MQSRPCVSALRIILYLHYEIKQNLEKTCTRVSLDGVEQTVTHAFYATPFTPTSLLQLKGHRTISYTFTNTNTICASLVM